MAEASVAFAALTFVAITKTLLTKQVFDLVSAPIAFSSLSCWVTCAALTAPVHHRATAREERLHAGNVDAVLVAAVTIGADLAFANVALSRVTLTLQQSIRATAPAFTLALEWLVHGRVPRAAVALTLCGVCVGPFAIAHGAVDAVDRLGALAMVASVLAGACKNVAAHAVIASAKKGMGVLLFTWWIELLVGALLLPWAVWSGGAAALWGAPPATRWMTVATAAYGGVRILLQFCFLKHTSPTSAALSNVAVQALTTLGGIVLFGEPASGPVVAGVALTLACSCAYARLKIRS